MTTAQQNTQKQLSDLWESKGAFFAFSNQQLAEKAQKDVKYVSLFAGLVCPKENAEILLKEMAIIQENGIKADLEENGIEKIIERELANHEAWYTYEIDDTMDALSEYPGVTTELVWKVFHANAHKYDN